MKKVAKSSAKKVIKNQAKTSSIHPEHIGFRIVQKHALQELSPAMRSKILFLNNEILRNCGRHNGLIDSRDTLTGQAKATMTIACLSLLAAVDQQILVFNSTLEKAFEKARAKKNKKGAKTRRKNK